MIGPDAVTGRRAVLGASAAGIWSLTLPTAAVAASPTGDGVDAPSAPTITSALPAGHRSSDGADDDGAVEVTWSAVAEATSYAVRYRSPAGSGTYTTFPTTTSGTSLIVTGLATLDGSEPRTYDVVVAASNTGGTSPDSDPVSSGAVVASGGDTVALDGTSVVHTFTTVGAATLTLHRARDVTYLVVGGGGGGGAFVGGGGAGGEVVAGSEADVTGALTVTVGDGGTGGRHVSVSYTAPTAGSTSSIAAGDGSALGWAIAPVATGGGTGGGNGTAPTATATGGGGGLSPILGATGSSFSGGDGSDQPHYTGGGGAGAGADGSTATQSASGRGGDGVASSITGAPASYGGGGGGGVHGSNSGDFGPYTAGAGGSGGGGAGGAATSRLTAETVRGGHGTDGLGGGGGGAGKNSGASPADGETLTSIGGDGGSGVIIVRYALPSIT